MKKQRILFIGAGRMAEAIFSGLLHHQKEKIDCIIISNKSDHKRLKEMEKQYSVVATNNWQEEVNEADVILLACPPSAHPVVLDDLKQKISNQLVISVAAGVGLNMLETLLPAGTAAVWVMPNTAAEVGESMSIFTVGKHVTQNDKKVLEMILSGIGAFEECSEEQVHLLTAVTGSAPAFLYSFCEALEAKAISFGISSDQARKLVSQMVYGSGKMLINGGNPADLREQVTSPGGATAAGLAVLEHSQFHVLLNNAVDATNNRAQELGKSSSN